MPAPYAIVHGLESVVDIYLSSVRHRERAAFILCDNLVEMVCKTKAVEHNHRFQTNCSFHDAWNAPGVQLPRRTLGRKIQNFRNVRNNMQHGSAAATVDSEYCAGAILTAVEVIDRCWRNSSNNFSHWLQVALRVIHLYSTEGDAIKRRPFENSMQNIRWRGDESTYIRLNEVKIDMGHRDHWQIAIRSQPHLVEGCLNELEVN